MSMLGPLQPLVSWHRALQDALQRHGQLARVTLASVRGSAPREPGVTMLVAPCEIAGTIGGGRLEWEAAAAARKILGEAGSAAQCRKIVLSAELGQCCGGVVELWIERFAREDLPLLEAASRASQCGPTVLVSIAHAAGVERRIVRAPGEDVDADQLLNLPRAQAAPRVRRTCDGGLALIERLDCPLAPVWLFGAGHVGQALARIMGELPVSLTWIDSRAGQFPAQMAQSIRRIETGNPAQSVALAPAGSHFLVMTHSHALDYAICRSILHRGDFAWAGLIGSKSKAARFRSRMRRDGIEPEVISRLVCPIGVGGISSKWPSAIAVAIAAQILQHLSGEIGTQEAVARPPEEGHCAQGECARCGPGAVETA